MELELAPGLSAALAFVSGFALILPAVVITRVLAISLPQTTLTTGLVLTCAEHEVTNDLRVAQQVLSNDAAASAADRFAAIGRFGGYTFLAPNGFLPSSSRDI